MPTLDVRHVTTYRYARPVGFGLHRAMLRPRDSHDLKLRSATLSVSPKAKVRWVHDVFGNSVTLLDFGGETADALRIESRLAIERYSLASPDYPVSPEARRWPFAYGDQERRDLGPTLDRHHPDPQGKVRDWARSFADGGETDSVELLAAMTKGMKASFRYAAREDEGTQPPAETLEKGTGSCRDYALLMMEGVRALGLAARFVTGYLYSPALDKGAATSDGSDIARPDVQGAGATHAWVQVYLPGAGWLEFDPTNGLVGGPDLIRVAVVRDPTQAAPLSGTYTGAAEDFVGIEVDVQVTRRDPTTPG